MEIIVLPVEEEHSEKSEKASKIEEVVNSLVGVIPNNSMSLADFREERLKKYKIVD